MVYHYPSVGSILHPTPGAVSPGAPECPKRHIKASKILSEDLLYVVGASYKPSKILSEDLLSEDTRAVVDVAVIPLLSPWTLGIIRNTSNKYHIY